MPFKPAARLEQGIQPGVISVVPVNCAQTEKRFLSIGVILFYHSVIALQMFRSAVLIGKSGQLFFISPAPLRRKRLKKILRGFYELFLLFHLNHLFLKISKFIHMPVL